MSSLVSVIIAFYNEELFLEEAIESVLLQTYTNWELILVDDGSSDNSTTIAKLYSAKYPAKIFYFEHSYHLNRGLSASRNHGISAARGELIALLDADDIWLPGKLQSQVSIMIANADCKMLCEASEYWQYELPATYPQKIKQVGKTQDQLFFPPQLSKELYPLANGNAPCPSGILVRKSTVLKHNGFEEQFTGKFQMYEDQAFLQKIYLNEPVYISSACNNRYRQRNGSLVQKVTADGNYHVVRRYFLKWLSHYMLETRCKDREVKKLIHKALRKYKFPILYRLKSFIGSRLRALLKRNR